MLRKNRGLPDFAVQGAQVARHRATLCMGGEGQEGQEEEKDASNQLVVSHFHWLCGVLANPFPTPGRRPVPLPGAIGLVGYRPFQQAGLQQGNDVLFPKL